MATIDVPCRYCSQIQFVHKNGKASTGIQRYRCMACNRSFQYQYLNNGNAPGIPERIIEMAMNGSGVRDTSRVLNISITTVISHLKNSPLRK